MVSFGTTKDATTKDADPMNLKGKLKCMLMINLNYFTMTINFVCVQLVVKS